MADSLVLIDSSVWIEALREDGDVRWRECVDALMAERRASTCEVVIAEVLAGALNEAHLSELTAGLQATIILDMEDAGQGAGRLALGLRQRGLTIHTTDLLIAATAQLHDAALLHRDKHLEEAAGLLGLQIVQP